MRAKNLTEHAQRRKQQRGFSDLQVELLRLFGEDKYQKGGCSLSYIPEKKLTQLRDAIDKLRNVAMIKNDSDIGISIMHMDRRIHTTRYAA